MSMTPRAQSLRTACLLLAAACLAACGVAEEAKKKMDALGAGPEGSFETATRTKVEDAPNGRTYLLRVKSRRSAHWYEAMSAMSQDLDGYCADDVPFSPNRMSPELDTSANAPGEYTWHPAGTVFEQEIICSDPFAAQRAVAADADTIATVEALKTDLVAGLKYDRDRHLLTVVPFNDRNRKYPAVAEMIGSMVMGVSRRCRNAGVQVRQLLVYSKPTPDPSQGVFLNRSEAFVGIDAVCSDGAPADPRL